MQYQQDHFIYGLHVSNPLELLVGCQFDPCHELLWACTDTLMTSYALPSMQLYTRFPLVAAGGQRYPTTQQQLSPLVCRILVHELGAFGLTSNSLSHVSRQGIPQTKFTRSDLIFTCLASGTNKADIVLGGPSPTLYSVTRGKLALQISIEEGVQCMKRGKYLACGSVTGKVFLKDPRTLKTQHTILAHPNCVADLDIVDNTLVTCAFSQRGNPFLMEGAVKVYDLRNASQPVDSSFFNSARFVTVNPDSSCHITIASNLGQVQIRDISKKDTSFEFQVNTGGRYLSGMSISSTGDRMAFTDAGGNISTYFRGETPMVNFESEKIPMPSFVARQPIEMTENTPLNVIGMPYYSTQLFSAHWPKRTFRERTHPVVIPPEVLDSLKVTDFVGHAPNTLKGKRLRNQVPDTSSFKGPKFRSEREKERKDASPSRDDPDNLKLAEMSISSPSNGGNANAAAVTSTSTLPSYYLKQKIKYSRFGVEDFDFEYYNDTQMAGLENDIIHCYGNSFLQLLVNGYGGVLSQIAVWHLNGRGATKCEREFCLLCETGFLAQMMNDARGNNCQATNLFRVLGMTSEAAALGLLEISAATPKSALHLLIQTLHRFLMEKFHQESTSGNRPQPSILNQESGLVDKNASVVSQLCGVRFLNKSTCMVCKYSSSRENTPFFVDITYPKSSSSPQKLPAADTFSSLIQDSLSRSSTTKTWCDKCKTYTLSTQQKSAENLPPVLTINTGGMDEEERQFWRGKDSWFKFQCDDLPVGGPFILPKIKIDLDAEDGKVVSRVKDGDVQTAAPSDRCALYELSALVCQVENGSDPTHVVAFIKHADEWYIFNDFLVKKVSLAEAIQFRSRWKVPAILQYVRCDIDEVLSIDSLYENHFASLAVGVRRPSRSLFDSVIYPIDMRGVSQDLGALVPLTFDEFLKDSRFLVAIDAEFVALNLEESEVRSDGTRSVVRPTRMHLARVSLVRGQGDLEGVPFVDDYIYTSEPVADYLTDFSGISAQDLIPAQSKRNLVVLKTAYKKLRMLLDMGVVFVGHGLKKDFRTINIFVKRSSVIDTVDIYRMEGQRKVSLRFLSWYVLGKDIQSESHDSIIDAQIALELYKKYLELYEKGEFQAYLETLYEEGRKLNWKPLHWQSLNERHNLVSDTRSASPSDPFHGQPYTSSPFMPAAALNPHSRSGYMYDFTSGNGGDSELLGRRSPYPDSRRPS